MSRTRTSGELRRPHHVDLKTGMYRGRQVLAEDQGSLSFEPDSNRGLKAGLAPAFSVCGRAPQAASGSGMSGASTRRSGICWRIVRRQLVVVLLDQLISSTPGISLRLPLRARKFERARRESARRDEHADVAVVHHGVERFHGSAPMFASFVLTWIFRIGGSMPSSSRWAMTSTPSSRYFARGVRLVAHGAEQVGDEGLERITLEVARSCGR